MIGFDFKLLAACCRWSYSADPKAGIPGLSAQADWPRFLHLARRHRVQSLVNFALQGNGILPPSSISEELGQDARAIAEQNLRAASESARLAETFANSGVDLLFVKGLTLSALGYGDPFLKASMDIDVLVEPGAVRESALILESLGYRATIPAVRADSERLRTWHGHRKESVWESSASGLTIELHTALADSPALIPTIGMASPRQMVPVTPRWTFPTLATEELFAYLSVHGTWSAWFRMKWLSDIAALVHHQGSGAAERLYEKARNLGAGRAPAQALILSECLFGLELPASLRKELRRDRVNSMLAKIALRELQQDRSPAERRLGTLPLHLIRPFLVSGWRSKFSEINRQLQDVVQHATLPA